MNIFTVNANSSYAIAGSIIAVFTTGNLKTSNAAIVNIANAN